MTDDTGRHLQHVRDCRKDLKEAEDDFIEAVLHATRAGASQRQIGDAAGLSHARIGQIVRQYNSIGKPFI